MLLFLQRGFMACEKCNNVPVSGPKETQLYIDPFSIEPQPRFFKCIACGQFWWCTAEPDSGSWVQVNDRKSILAVINGWPVQVCNGEAVSV
jgi:hypothetical protein